MHEMAQVATTLTNKPAWVDLTTPDAESARSYWLVYFTVDDVDARFAEAIELGGREVVAPREMPGGWYAIVADPQGATFGLIDTQ